jgi:hypothetical protein
VTPIFCRSAAHRKRKPPARVGERDAKPLHALGEDAPIRTKIIVCTEPSERRLDSGVRVMPVRRFLDELWGGRDRVAMSLLRASRPAEQGSSPQCLRAGPAV